MPEPEYPRLSEEEHAEERRASEALLRFLKTKLDSLSFQERRTLYKQLSNTVEGAFIDANKKLSRMSDLVWKNPGDRISIKWGFHSTEDAFRFINKSAIEWGRANWESKTITLLSVISFAPKEIIREVTIHEALHIVYKMIDHDCFSKVQAPSYIVSAVTEYPMENQDEELWVRSTIKRLGFDERNLPLWELAVEQAGEDWRPLYYQLKKDRKRL